MIVAPRRSLFLRSLLGLCLMTAIGGARLAEGAPAVESPDAAQARALYEKGMARFHLEEYDAAIELWEAGFRIRPVPELLYNIAQAHRLAKRPDKALGFYQKFLRLNPKASNRAEVERHITVLEQVVRDNTAAANGQPMTTRDPAPTPTPAPAVAPTVTPEVVPAANQVVAAPPAKKPIYKKAWFWGVVGGSVAAVVIVGVTVGLVLGDSQPETLPTVRF